MQKAARVGCNMGYNNARVGGLLVVKGCNSVGVIWDKRMQE